MELETLVRTAFHNGSSFTRRAHTLVIAHQLCWRL